jgi:hypothetical protein
VYGVAKIRQSFLEVRDEGADVHTKGRRVLSFAYRTCKVCFLTPQTFTPTDNVFLNVVVFR